MSADLFLRVAAVVILVVGFSFSGYYRARAELRGGKLPEKPEGLPPIGLRLAIGLLVWPLLGFQVAAPRRVEWSFLDLPQAVRWLGFGLGVLAVPGIWWTMRSIGLNVSASIEARANASLVTHGPYRWIRHPIYTFGFTLVLAFGLMIRSWPLFLVLLLVLPWLPHRARREEGKLVATFGDEYRAYQTRTGRFLPRAG